VRCRVYARTLRNAGLRSLRTTQSVKANLVLRESRWRFSELLEPRPDLEAAKKRETLYSVPTRLAFSESNDFGDLIDWLEIEDSRLGIGVVSLNHARLEDIEEGALTPGARIVCDLKLGKKGWYASRIHRVAD
jgi:hypothetical protein